MKSILAFIFLTALASCVTESPEVSAQPCATFASNMPKPSSYVDWDTNLTNTVAVVSGHASDGYLDNEVPTAAETNGWMSYVGKWTRWFDGYLTASRTMPIDISKGHMLDIGGSTGTFTLSGSVRYLVATAGPTHWYFPIELPVGSVITEVVVGYNREAAASVSFELDRWSLAGSETVVASQADTTSVGDTTTAFSTFPGALLPFTVLANETLSVAVTSATNGRIYAVLVTYTPPAS